MSIFSEILLFLFNYIFIKAQSVSWKASIKDHNNDNPIKLHKGVYTPLKLVLQYESTSNSDFIPFPLIDSFILDSNLESSYVLYYESNKINSYIATEYDIYLGLVKDAQDYPSFSLSFAKISFQSIPVDISSDPKTIVLFTNSPKNFYKALNYYYLKEELYNMETECVSSNSDDKYEIYGNWIDPFNKRNKIDESNPTLSFYYNLKESEFIPNTSIEVTINSDSKYFKYEPFKIQMVNESMPKLDDPSFAKDFNDSFTITQNNNSIIASIISPISCVLIHCRLYSSNLYFYKGVDIFSIEEKEKFIIPYYNLSRIFKYYVYCYFDDPNNRGPIIFSDTKRELEFEYSNEIHIPCLDWTFENPSENDIYNFNNTVIFYCHQLIASEFGNYLDNGCLYCKSQIFQINKVRVCAFTEPVCPSYYSEKEDKLSSLFTTMANNLKTPNDIMKNLHLDSFKSKATNISDVYVITPPDIRTIDVVYKGKNATHVLMDITSRSYYPIYCKYELILYPEYDDYNLEYQIHLIVEETRRLVLKYTMPEDEKDRLHQFYITCSFLDSFDFSSEVYLLKHFFLGDEVDSNYHDGEKFNCNTSKKSPQCLEKGSIGSFKTDQIYEMFNISMEEEFDYFPQLNFSVIQGLLKVKIEYIEQYVKSKEYMEDLSEKVWKVESIMNYTDCRMTNNYDRCRDDKKLKQKLLFHLFKQYLTNCSMIESIVKELVDGVDNECTYEKFKKNIDSHLNSTISLIMVAGMSVNVDLMDDEQFNYATEINQCVINKIEDIFKIYDYYAPWGFEGSGYDLSEIKEDIISVFAQISTNLMKYISYFEVDNPLRDILDKKSGMIKIENLIKIKKNIENAIKMYLFKGSGEYNVNNITINVFKKESTSRQLENNKYSYPSQGVEIEINIQEILNQYNGEWLQIFIYNQYPLLSVDNKVISPYFIGIRIFDKDKNEKTVKNITKEYRPKILFSLKGLNNSFNQCYYYSDYDNNILLDGIETGNETIDGVKYISCTISHFTDFSIGISGIKSHKEPIDSKSSRTWIIILVLCVIVIALITGGYFIYYYYISKKTVKYDELPSQSTEPLVP